jgi:hypothetical protein
MQTCYHNLGPFIERAAICVLNKSANFGNTIDRKLVWQLNIWKAPKYDIFIKKDIFLKHKCLKISYV